MTVRLLGFDWVKAGRCILTVLLPFFTGNRPKALGNQLIFSSENLKVRLHRAVYIASSLQVK